MQEFYLTQQLNLSQSNPFIFLLPPTNMITDPLPSHSGFYVLQMVEVTSFDIPIMMYSFFYEVSSYPFE